MENGYFYNEWCLFLIFLIVYIYCCNLFYFISVDDGLQGKLNFLEENKEPWSTIVEYWTDTSKQRIAKLHVKSRITNRNKSKENGKRNANVKSKFKNRTIPQTTQVGQEKEVKNISTYINQYPALKEKLGYTLVNI